MSIKAELKKLKETDLWSLLLFALFKVKDTPEYSCLSELAYILDRDNLLKLCEYFGGCTITIPKVEEVELFIYGLLLYQYVDIEHIEFTDAIELVTREGIDIRAVKTAYHSIKNVLENYNFVSRVDE